MGTKATPPEIINIADDNAGDDDISILYSWHNKKTKTNNPINKKTKITNPINPISVENYCNTMEKRNPQLSRLSQINCPKSGRTRNVIDLCSNSEYPDDIDLQVSIFNSFGTKNRKKPLFNKGGVSIFEKGESSNSRKFRTYDIDDDDDVVISPIFMCGICAELKQMSESFSVKGCTHSYCSDCIQKYVASKIQENISRIQCPVSGCGGVLEPEYCKPILPSEVFDRWGDALCEGLILASEKFYCPFKDCSALLIRDGEESSGSIVESECPVCRRMFCAQCKVAWHAGIECREFQTLHKDEREREDIMLMQLAKNKKWIRCPQCKFFVEKSDGCLYMRCRFVCCFLISYLFDLLQV